MTQCLTADKLARIIDGRLHLSSMPPVAGPSQHVRRIIVDSRRARPGDVFFELPYRRAAGAEGCWPEEAFARGAAGVVSAGRVIEPWAGAFSVSVDDPSAAFIQLARWARRCWRGKVVAVAEGNAGHVSRTLAAMLQAPVVSIANAEQFAEYCFRRTRAARFHVVRFADDALHDVSRILALSRPDFLAITSPHTDWLPSVLDSCTRTKRGIGLVKIVVSERCAGDRKWSDSSPSDRVSILSVGTTSDGEGQISGVRRQGWHTEFGVASRRIRLAALPDWPVEDLAVAHIIGHRLGFSTPAFVAACQSLLVRRAAEHVRTEHSRENEEVPPLVSDLRESEATLPPGLKRFAR